MFSKSHAWSFKTMIALFAVALFASASAHASKEKFERTKPHVNVGSDAPPLAIDIVVDSSSGRLEGAIMPLYELADIALKRGTVRILPEGIMEGTYETQILYRTGNGSELPSDLTVGFQGVIDDESNGSGHRIDILRWDDASAAATPEWKYVPVRRTAGAAIEGADEGGDIILFAADSIHFEEDFSRNAQQDYCCPADSFSIHFAKIESDNGAGQIWGEPPYLFNTPGPDEDLVAKIPVPFPGEVFFEELRVYSSERHEPRVVQVQIGVLYQF